MVRSYTYCLLKNVVILFDSSVSIADVRCVRIEFVFRTFDNIRFEAFDYYYLR